MALSSIVSSEALAGLLNMQADLEEETRNARQERLDDLLHWDASPDVLTAREVPAFMRLLELSSPNPVADRPDRTLLAKSDSVLKCVA